MDISTIFLLFIVYSLSGWILEVVYCAIITHRFINRGFLNGPLCPIYGAGGILVIFALEPFSEYTIVLFIVAGLATSCLEYATSWLLESIFSAKWWDYSDKRFNLHGRICLTNTLAFGAMSVLVVRLLDPMLRSILGQAPRRPLELVTLSLFAIISFDFIATLIMLSGLEKKSLDIKSFTKDLMSGTEDVSWFDPERLDTSLVRLRILTRRERSEKNVELLLRYEKVLRHSRGMQRIFSSFPAFERGRHNFRLDSFTQIEKVNDHCIEAIETIKPAITQ